MSSTNLSPPPSARRSGRVGLRVVVIGVISAAALLGVVGTASAHVTAQPGSAEQGSEAKIAFRTMNEEETAATVKLEVSFPTDHPIASVSTQPIPGWTATVDKTTLPTPLKTMDGEVSQAVSKITWSGGKIDPDQFQEFTVSLGPLPTDTTVVVFKAVQTYDNGDVVRWIEDTPAGGPEPTHPAPTLTLTKPADKTPEGGTATGAGTAGSSNTATSPGSSATAALTLGVVGAALGLVGAVLGGLALRRRGSGTPAG